MGNTPTCVGKTEVEKGSTPSRQKHPHVRGEDDLLGALFRRLGGNTPTCVGKTILFHVENHIDVETPPRAWGRLIDGISMLKAKGNTPTCVGKTSRDTCKRSSTRKHPHVRGEDRFSK